MDFNDIIQKHNYGRVFGAFLKQVYDELVKYYGDEKLIYNAFLDTDIQSVENVYAYLNEHDYLDDIITDGDVKRRVGLYASKVIISYDEGFHIEEVKRIVLVKHFDIDSEESKGNLIHVLCHMINSYYNEYKIDGDLLVRYSGLTEKYYKLSFENGKVEKRLLKEVGMGLEEGLVSIMEKAICQKIVAFDYEMMGFGAVRAIASKFIMDKKTNDLVKDVSLYHSKEMLLDMFGDVYTSFEKGCDQIYDLNLEMYERAINPSIRQEILRNIEIIVGAEVMPLLKEIIKIQKRRK